MAYLLCRHVRTNGRRCQAAALKDELWCYFHNKLHARHRQVRPVGQGPGPGALDLPAIEDRDSVQVALSLVVSALAGGKLDEKRARAIFHGLTLAARNLTDLMPLPTSDYRVSSYLPTLDGFAMAPAETNDGSPPPPRQKPIPKLGPDCDPDCDPAKSAAHPA